MKKADMAYTKAELKKRNSPMECAPSKDAGPKYPYGLELSLDNVTLDKLGIGKLPRVGKKIRIEAVAEVTRVSQSERRGEKDDRTVGLQIVSMGCESAPQSMEDAVEDGIEAAE